MLTRSSKRTRHVGGTISQPQSTKSNRFRSVGGETFQTPGKWRPIQTITVCLCALTLLCLLFVIFYPSQMFSNSKSSNDKDNQPSISRSKKLILTSNPLFPKDADNEMDDEYGIASFGKVRERIEQEIRDNLQGLPELDINVNCLANGEQYIQNIDGYLNNIYNVTHSKLIRMKHISPVYSNAQAKPHLIGLGAEKSGSTGIGVAIQSSKEYLCPRKDRPIDTEQRYWSDKKNCPFTLGMTPSQVLDIVDSTKHKRCSVNGYLNENDWSSKQESLPLFEKSVAYLGMDYVTYIFNKHFSNVNKGTKIFVMIRYPPPRIQSTWYFFVGNERTKIKDHYGNVEIFTKYLMSNKELHKMVDMLKADDYQTSVVDLDWKNEILPQWNVYFNSLIQECRDDSKIAGFKAEYCDTPQLLRRAVALSCYIVPAMQWLTTMDDPINQFRIIQSELYFSDPQEIIRRLICWDKQGNMDEKECDGKEYIDKLQVKKAQTTNRNSIEMSDGLLDDLHSFFEPCNRRLFELLQLFPQLAIKEFEWEHWMYTPNHVTVVN